MTGMTPATQPAGPSPARHPRAGPGPVPSPPPPQAAARIIRALCDHPGWSAFWDKSYRVWRVADDDPDSRSVRREQRRRHRDQLHPGARLMPPPPAPAGLPATPSAGEQMQPPPPFPLGPGPAADRRRADTGPPARRTWHHRHLHRHHVQVRGHLRDRRPDRVDRRPAALVHLPQASATPGPQPTWRPPQPASPPSPAPDLGPSALSARSRKVIMTMRLRILRSPSPRLAARNNRHIPCIYDHAGHWRLLLLRGRLGIAMTVQAHDTTTTTITTAPARPARRADAGTVRLSQRDIDGLILAGEHYGAPPTCSLRRCGSSPTGCPRSPRGGGGPGTPPPAGSAPDPGGAG